MGRPKKNLPRQSEQTREEDSSTETLLEMSQEPSLGDLREMLVDIQITVNSILLEDK